MYSNYLGIRGVSFTLTSPTELDLVKPEYTLLHIIDVTILAVLMN